MLVPPKSQANAPAPGDVITFEALPQAGLAWLLACAPPPRPWVLIAPDDDRAEQLAGDLRSLGLGDVQLLAGDDHVPFDEASPDPRVVFQHSAVRNRLLSGTRPQVIVATVSAAAGRWISDRDFTANTARWAAGQEVARAAMLEQLVRCGYQRVNMVEDMGTFAVRGSIVDVFAPERSRPVRLDLFGDDIASIKAFEPSTQRTFDNLDAVTVYPIREVVFDDATVARAVQRLRQMAEEEIEIPTRYARSLVEAIEQRDYFYGIEALWPAFYADSTAVLDSLLGDDAMLVVDDATRVMQRFEERWQRAEHERARRIERHEPAVTVAEHLLEPDEARHRIMARAGVRSVTLADDRVDRPRPSGLSDWGELAAEIKARRDDASRGEILDPLMRQLQRLFAKDYDVFLTCGSRGHAERLRELLLARKVDLPLLDALPPATSVSTPHRASRRAIAVAGLSSGLCDTVRRVAFVTDVEIFGTPPRRRSARRKPPPQGLTTLKGLDTGDLVIHVDHGIGRYLGLTRLILNGVDGDYVHLEYAGGDKLYLPIYRLNVLQRYQGSQNAKLDKLGGSRWEKAKQRVKDAVLQLAHGLLALQARRQTMPGFRLPSPDEHFRAFEATFPYEETPDQQRAIDEVVADLTQDRPMDRLVCGDVGFGKTEVAMRAAFLAVLGGRQVAVLVPTTVLAEQHGMTFRERLEGQGVRVEVLSRFRTTAETREMLQQTRHGAVDILIGTHRLLSPDVHFKNLGLLVVDEEQRFGVRHKERIKELRSQVHVLTLSATPIPRTLHMAMVGLRDLSIIQTPPAERMAIKTEVTRFDEEVIAEAIRRELHRGGQVFVVHNRVHSIGAMASLVHRLVPEAKAVVAHGQMHADKLEKIMVDFVRRDANVLISTAIIESGIDIPSANTMIVNRADTFGLAQLYQLRGRIGRGRDRAYAYLLLPRASKITHEAQQRLAVLKRFSELGAGFQIASHDLDLRGAGDLLGADQSGNITAVGFELYTELLAEAVERAKGQQARHIVEPDIKLPVAAVLPESYVSEPMQRLAYYQRLAQAPSDEAIFDICAEIEDLYGKAPDELAYLAEVMVIRRRLVQLGASHLSGSIHDGAIKIGLTFIPEAEIDRAVLALRLQQQPDRYRLLPSGRLAVTVPAAAEIEPLDFLREVRRQVGELPCTPPGAGTHHLSAVV